MKRWEKSCKIPWISSRTTDRNILRFATSPQTSHCIQGLREHVSRGYQKYGYVDLIWCLIQLCYFFNPYTKKVSKQKPFGTSCPKFIFLLPHGIFFPRTCETNENSNKARLAFGEYLKHALPNPYSEIQCFKHLLKMHRGMTYSRIPTSLKKPHFVFQGCIHLLNIC